MALRETFIMVSSVALLIKLSMAANHIVGGTNGGWDASSNLQAWPSSQKFLVGDNLIFQYPPNHNVVEVTKADYDSCQPSNPIKSYSDGATTIPLSSPGKRYFICGTLGHCSQGMKVQIDTLATATTSSISPAASPLPVDSPAASPLPFIPTVSSPAADSPEYTPGAHSPNLEPQIDSPALSPVVPSTEFPTAASPVVQHSTDPSAASAKEGNLQSFIAIVLSFLMMLLAF